MWFQFPEGTTSISVQQQVFDVEFVDDLGARYFRAPEHFAASIVDLPGFVRVPPPKGAPEDLPKTFDNETSKTVEQLTGHLSVRDLEIGHLKSRLAELSAERDDLKLKVNELEGKIDDLEEEKNEEKAAVKPVFSPGTTSASSGVISGTLPRRT